MARASNLDDATITGLHIGACSFPTALAMAEFVGGCSGKEFLTSLVVGSEIAARINSQCVYGGFDPTGVCGIFATAAIAGKIIGLDLKEMWNALALAFVRGGGSFQAIVDNSIGARIISGFVCQGGITCAQLAKKNVNGPQNFLEGIYGYFHFYTQDGFDAQLVVEGLGERYEISKTLFKQYPSCATTSGCTQAILELIEEKDITPEGVSGITVKVTPRSHRLVGGAFVLGDNPAVSGKYSIEYCVANALLRKSSKLQDFDESSVSDPPIMELIKKVHPIADSTLGSKCSHETDVEVKMKSGAVYHKRVDIPQGYPENPLSKEQHLVRFRDCIKYAEDSMSKPLSSGNIEKIIWQINHLERMEDVCSIVPLLLSP
jgi:2-methylcitrate dehydratase PrpD